MSITEKIKDFNIKNIISIDNDWTIASATYDGEENIYSFLQHWEIEFTEREREEIDNEAITNVQELLHSKNEILECLIEKINERLKPKPIDVSLLALKNVLEEITLDYPEVNVEISDSVKEEYETIQGNSLYILDKNMGGDQSDIIISQILALSDRKETTDLILIFSNECGEEFENHTSKMKYIEKSQKDMEYRKKLRVLYQLWAIPKVGDKNKLKIALDEMLLKALYGVALIRILEYKMSEQEKVFKEFLLSDSDELESVFNDSFIEGDNFNEIIDRLLMALQREKELTEDLESINTLMQYVLKVEKYKIEDIRRTLKTDDDYKKFKTDHIRKKLSDSTKNSSTYGIADYTVNFHYKDLATGDLFRWKDRKSNEWKYGILISQECDNIIRMPLNKISDIPIRKNKTMQLLLLNEIEIPKNQGISNNCFKKLENKIASRIWPVKIGDVFMSFGLQPNIKLIDSEILDACTLNSEGNCVIGLKNDELNRAIELKSYHSGKYFKDFFSNQYWREFNQDVNLSMSFYRDIFYQKTDISKEEQAGYFEDVKDRLREFIIEQKVGFKFHENTFIIQRICRIEAKRTLIAIQDYVYSMSKTGATPVSAR
jgi:hypothetical protein